MKPCFLHLFIFGAFVSIVFGTCENDFKKCNDIAQKIMRKNDERIWPTDANELAKNCGDLTSFSSCVASYSETCKSTSSKSAEALTSTEDVLKALCNKETDISKKYLANAECINKNKGAFSSCTPVDLSFQTEGVLKHSCDIFAKKTTCELKKSGELCGDEAKSVLEKMINPQKEMMREMCKELGIDVDGNTDAGKEDPTECHDNYKKCINIAEKIMHRNEEKKWAADSKELNKMCKDTGLYDKCITSHSSKCKTTSPDGVKALLKTGNVLTDLCQEDTNLRKKYLAKAKCMNDNVQTFVACNDIDLSFEVVGVLKHACEVFAKGTKCELEQGKKLCGDDARSVQEKMVEPQKEMMKTTCKDLGVIIDDGGDEKDKKKDDGGGGVSAMFPMNWVIVAALFLLVRLHFT